MADINGIKIEPRFNLPKIQLGKGGSNTGQGGDAGSITIISESLSLSRNGQFIAEGGNGVKGGKGGDINIHSQQIDFKGNASTKGGDSHGKK